MKNIVVLVSGGGTNLQALIDAEKRGEIRGGKITCVIASKADAYALTRAADNGIKTRVLARRDFPDVKSYYDHRIWSKATVAKSVKKGWITADEYAEIVGEPYAA